MFWRCRYRTSRLTIRRLLMKSLVIIQDGIRRMYKDGENVFYYITVMNEPYAMPAMPGDVKDGILRGMYRFRPAANAKSKLRAQLFGSGRDSQ